MSNEKMIIEISVVGYREHTTVGQFLNLRLELDVPDINEESVIKEVTNWIRRYGATWLCYRGAKISIQNMTGLVR